MLERRHSLTILCFFLLCLYGVLAAFILEFDGTPRKEEMALERESARAREREREREGRRESYFKKANYYISPKGRPFLHLRGQKVIFNRGEEGGQGALILRPSGLLYTKKGDPIHYKAQYGTYEGGGGPRKFYLNGDVVLNTEDSEVLSKEMTYFPRENKIFVEGEVKTKTLSQKSGHRIFVNAHKLVVWPEQERFHYQEGVRGKLQRWRIYEQGIEFKSRELFLNMKTLKGQFFGEVFIKKGDIKSYSHRGEIFLENYNKTLKYFILYDDVKIIDRVLQREGQKWIQRRALAEKLEGIVSEGKYILTGYPKVFQEDDVIKGYRIILREGQEVLEVDDSNTNLILK